MFKNCRKLFLLVFRNTQLGCQYLPIFDCDKDLSDDLQCNLLRDTHSVLDSYRKPEPKSTPWQLEENHDYGNGHRYSQCRY